MRLNEAANTLAAKDHCQILQASVPNLPLNLAENGGFDIVFLDPPYHQELLSIAVNAVIEANLLNTNAYVFIECEHTLSLDFLSWQPLKLKQTNTLQYGLWLT